MGEVDETPENVFWADAVAESVQDRNPADPIIIKGGISPSGVPHLGHVNELLRGYFIAAVLRERGHEVRQVFTTDDRDPLRSLPRTLCSLDGELVDLGAVDAGALGRNLGLPYTDVPDPFNCCDSYGEHFSRLIADSASALDLDVEFVSTTDLYTQGKFDDYTHTLLEQRTAARELLAHHQAKVDDTYVPFNPICSDCGKVTETVTDVDLDAETVEYECTDIEAGDQTIEGCGYRGTATLREGKLPWRFEWPAQWAVLDVDAEPFGKDHAEGSWPSGQEIARALLEIDPPVPLVYEWFTLDGEPLSSSTGNVIQVEEVLDLIEPAVLRYFFALDPKKARDFSVDRIDQLVDDFDRFEAIYFGEETGTAQEEAFADRVYPLVVERVRPERIRLPYTFAAVLGMTDDPTLREDIASREGHIPDDAPEWAVEAALNRVERARRWARRTDNAFAYELHRSTIPETDFDADTEAALEELASVVAAGQDGETLQGEIYEIAKRHDLDIGEFFAAGYRLFFDQPDGPRLGPFLARLDREFVVDRLRRER